jgi:hypothetical protein
MIQNQERFSVGKVAGSAIPFVAMIALLLIPAIVNGFPFIFVDSSDYIILTPRLYRSSFYQIFLFFSTLRISLWSAIIVQAAICCFVLGIIFKAFGQNGRLFLSLAALTFFSSLGIFVDFVMPDVFTGVIIIGLSFIFVDSSDYSKRKNYKGRIFFNIYSHTRWGIGSSVELAYCLWLHSCCCNSGSMVKGSWPKASTLLCCCLINLPVCGIGNTRLRPLRIQDE